MDAQSSKDVRGKSVVTPCEFLCTISSGTQIDRLEPLTVAGNDTEIANKRNNKSSWPLLEANPHRQLGNVDLEV